MQLPDEIPPSGQNDKIMGLKKEQGRADLSPAPVTILLHRPAPLPIDLQRLVIPNPITRVLGGRGEESLNRKEPD